MKKLTSPQQAQHKEIVDKLHEYNQTGSNLVDAYNEELGELYDSFTEKVEELGKQLMDDMARELDANVFAEASDFAGEVRDAASEFLDERPEEWKKGAQGQAYQSWMDEWDSAAVEIDDPQELVEADEVFDGAVYADWEDVEVDRFEEVCMSVEVG